ncbi:MAG TPA: hypothetical protein DDZ88_03865 [Verrucomicrobiales bacterium]|nr:hypothetical protein [Verrucomicrobiales bacterium]
MPHTKSKSNSRSLVRAAPSQIAAAPSLPVIDEVLTQARTTTRRAVDHAVAYAHDHPDKALLYALATGYVMRTLPVTRVLGGVLRVALPLIKPAAICYGISKLVLRRRA